MVRQLLRLTYPPELVNEPIVYRLGREFRLATNIRRANVTRDRGWVILELEGEQGDVARAVGWARQRGMVVEPMGGGLPD